MSDDTSTDHMSLEQIEGEAWGRPPADATRLMTTVYELRQRPLATLDAEDLRVLLSQQVGVEVLIPRVLPLLEADPLLEGDYYPGDVLVALLKTPAEYWSAHPDQLAKVRALAELVIDDVDAETRRDIEAFNAKTASID